MHYGIAFFAKDAKFLIFTKEGKAALAYIHVGKASMPKCLKMLPK